ncbi:MAG TPA: hypothetical protein VGB56_14205 [Flavisolibacter sp.]|jgi:hypothetical protein
MNQPTKLLLAVCMVLLLTSCWNIRNRNDLDQPLYKVWGFKPVYSSDTTLLKVTTIAPQPVKDAGKIFVMGHIIFQNEQGKGIHVLDKSNPSAIVNKGFIQIRGNTEVTLKGSFLYANSFSDLLVIDLKDWQAPVEVKKIKNAFLHGGSLATNLYLPPPQHGTYYECVNNASGVHTGWVQDSIYATCYYN